MDNFKIDSRANSKEFNSRKKEILIPGNILVSIIIPCYNVEKYIEECIEGVLSQTHKKLEIILIDDKSTDNTLKKLKRYENLDNRIKVIEHNINKGLGPSRNIGLSVAKGDYIFYLDSDDIIYNNAIEILLKEVIKNNSNMVVGSAESFDDITKEKYDFDRKFNNFNINLFGIRNNKDAFLGCFFIPEGNYIPLRAWGILYKKSFLLKINCNYPPLIHEDIPVIPFLYAKAKNPVYINNIIVSYRQREKSLSGNYNDILKLNNWKALWLIMVERLNFFKLEKHISDIAIFFNFHLFWKILNYNNNENLILEVTKIFNFINNYIIDPNENYFHLYLRELFDFFKNYKNKRLLFNQFIKGIKIKLLKNYYYKLCNEKNNSKDLYFNKKFKLKYLYKKVLRKNLNISLLLEKVKKIIKKLPGFNILKMILKSIFFYNK